MNTDQRYRWLYQPALILACLAPLAWLLARGLGWADVTLGANPVRELLHVLGKTAINLLWLTLAVTPLRDLLRAPQLLRLRRTLGLFAFGYALLHFTVYATLDLGFDAAQLGTDLVKRPYILVGAIALLALLPLAATSTQAMMRRLGRRWQTLHRLIYPATLLVVWHFAWQVKADLTEPLLYAAALAALLGWRAWRVRARRRVTSTSAAATTPGRT